jgi:hypothetical protein
MGGKERICPTGYRPFQKCYPTRDALHYSNMDHGKVGELCMIAKDASSDSYTGATTLTLKV